MRFLSLFAVCTTLAMGFVDAALMLPYPPVNAVPPTNSPQVQKWLSEIDFTKITAGPVNKCSGSSPPSNPPTTGQTLISNDVTTCPKGFWGLTYDDGPSTYSPRLYDALAASNQKATLFWIGGNIFQNQEIAKRACDAGHHIAVHTWSHHASTCLTNEQFVAEVKWTEAIIQEICGVTPKYFRPPYGDTNDRIRSLLTQMGYISIIWDRDSGDWKIASGQATVAEVEGTMKSWTASPASDTTGHISLEHDINPEPITIAISELPRLQKAYTVQTVAACLGDSNPYKAKALVRRGGRDLSLSKKRLSGTGSE